MDPQSILYGLFFWYVYLPIQSVLLVKIFFSLCFHLTFGWQSTPILVLLTILFGFGWLNMVRLHPAIPPLCQTLRLRKTYWCWPANLTCRNNCQLVMVMFFFFFFFDIMHICKDSALKRLSLSIVCLPLGNLDCYYLYQVIDQKKIISNILI